MSFFNLLFSVFFKMAASIDSHIGNVKSKYLLKNPISVRFASTVAVFQILLFETYLYFCVPFPLN